MDIRTHLCQCGLIRFQVGLCRGDDVGISPGLSIQQIATELSKCFKHLIGTGDPASVLDEVRRTAVRDQADDTHDEQRQPKPRARLIFDRPLHRALLCRSIQRTAGYCSADARSAIAA